MIYLKIREAGLKLKLSKCAVLKRHLDYLGHLISGEGIYPLKKRCSLLVNLAPHGDVIETRLNIELASYYKISANFSDTVKLLTDLTKKSPISNWSDCVK